jgi:hypothetical protein
VRKADNLPLPCADVKKSGGLNLMEPCGPVQACNETALTFLQSIRRQTVLFLFLLWDDTFRSKIASMASLTLL